MQDDNPILTSNIAKLIGSDPELPRFDPERRASALQSLHAQQIQASADHPRPSRLALLARTCMITVAAMVVLILIWSIPSAKYGRTHEAKVASLNAQLAEQQAEIHRLRARQHASAQPPLNNGLFDEISIEGRYVVTPEDMQHHKRMAPLVLILRDLELELSETSFSANHPEALHLRDVIETLRGTIGKYLSEDDINSFLQHIDKYEAE